MKRTATEALNGLQRVLECLPREASHHLELPLVREAFPEIRGLVELHAALFAANVEAAGPEGDDWLQLDPACLNEGTPPGKRSIAAEFYCCDLDLRSDATGQILDAIASWQEQLTKAAEAIRRRAGR